MNKHIEQAFANTVAQRELSNALATVANELIEEAKKEFAKQIQEQFFNINIEKIAQDIIVEKLEAKMRTFQFPDKSINHAAIDFTDFKLSQDALTSGTIQNFQSAGIQDISTETQLTVLDGMVVIENNCITNKLVVKDSASFDGDVKFNADVTLPDSVVTDVVEQAASNVTTIIEETFSKQFTDDIIRTLNDKISTNDLKIDGKSIVTGNALGNHITKSNIQRLGTLEECEVTGDAKIDGSLYVGNRLAINTINPSFVLDIWDRETNIVAGKHSKTTAVLGTTGYTALYLSAGAADNILLGHDGSTNIRELYIGPNKNAIGYSRGIPNTTGKMGDIMLSSVPTIGQPWGWMCLGGERWASMGILE